MSGPGFIYAVCAAAFLAGLASSYFSLPLWLRFSLRAGLVDHPGQRKIHDAPVPLAGGLAVLTGLLMPIFVAGLAVALWSQDRAGLAPVLDGMGQRGGQIAAIAAGAIAITVLGALDDRHVMRAKTKFAGQLLVALLLVSMGLRITLFVPNLLFSYVVSMLWILAVINAFNFMDNMNGLCAGLGAIGAGAFGLIALFNGQYLVAPLAFLMCGALIGFLPHNYPQARAFLGDSGSHLVGYMLAVMGILPQFHRPGQTAEFAIFVPALVLAVPLLDMTWVVLQRMRQGKPFYVGDTTHLSHRLVMRGLSKTRAVLAIWVMAAVLGGLAVASLFPYARLR